MLCVGMGGRGSHPDELGNPLKLGNTIDLIYDNTTLSKVFRGEYGENRLHENVL